MTKKHIKNNKQVSSQARKSFDKSYQMIREQESHKTPSPNKWLPSRGLKMSMIVILSFIVVGTPIGLAVGKYLGFDKFESLTLKKEGFIMPQHAVAQDQGVKLELADFYADNNEMGIHLKATLPNDTPLLKAGLETPKISLTVKDKKGQDISEYLSGKKLSYLDRESKVLDFFYILDNSNKKENLVEKLSEAKLEVYRIGGIYEGQKTTLKVGLNQLKGESVEGKWLLPLDTTKLKQFESLEYTPSEKQTLPIHQFLITPTKIMISFDTKDWETSGITFNNNEAGGSNPVLTGYRGDTKKVIPFETSTSLAYEADTSYPQLLFDFGGYDTYDRFVLDLDGHEPIEFIKK
ncbi:DUF4179 domain-containing protein [Vagococcus sp. PNs007]|uniref:DUF4179 domain-containing protein n=1 Tax=Vagococcus proximus TaxID=2991417 RepID=A0ABT5X0G7_9ENTE|nr:DUF4179 domain-containing protein [Vagococcus proximus]MDF0479366.1 DUF4179 domain-containing protein [Vagococcus proximus]